VDLTLTFTAVALIGAAATAAVVLLLRPHLRRLLVEICGSGPRAGFWLAAALLGVALCGLLSATSTLGYSNDGSPHDLFLGGVSQLRVLLVGLLGSLVVVAWALGAAIKGFEQRAERRTYLEAMKRSTPPAQPPQARPAMQSPQPPQR
jgi:hypothetical protein